MILSNKVTLETIDGATPVKKITITNSHGMRVELVSLGAALYQIYVPDRNGQAERVLLEYADFPEFLKTNQYYGKTIGRTSGRIGGAKLILGEKTYHLEANDHGNNLHAGDSGFHQQNFRVRVRKFPLFTRVIFRYVSPDGEGGFPGRVRVRVIYTVLKSANEIHVTYEAKADSETVLNLTNHAYFNLSGNFKDTIANHTLQLDASRYVAMNEQLVGYAILPVTKTLDFTVPKKVGKDLHNASLQDHTWLGYDHGFVRDEPPFDMPFATLVEEKPFAVLYDPTSGREMRLYTDYPCLNVYSDNYPSGLKLAHGQEEKKHQAICLEPEYVPFDFASYVLPAGHAYHKKFRLVFKTR